MKLCFVGNSHVVAVLQAWKELTAGRKDLEGVFFAAPGTRLKAFEVDGRSLVCRRPLVKKQLEMTSGGASAIDVDAYDGFVLIGLRLGLAGLLRAGTDHRTLGTLGKAKSDHIVSDAAFDLSLRRLFDETPFARIVRMIRSISRDARIVGLPTPLPCPDVAVGVNAFWRDAALLAQRIEPTWRACAKRFAEKHDVLIVDQRPETIERGAFTKASYGIGTVRLETFSDAAADRDDEDTRHMNAAFGALLLKDGLQHFGIAL